MLDLGFIIDHLLELCIRHIVGDCYPRLRLDPEPSSVAFYSVFRRRLDCYPRLWAASLTVFCNLLLGFSLKTVFIDTALLRSLRLIVQTAHTSGRSR